jgi:hypothetical protein
MNLAPVEVEHAQGRCLANERRMRFTPFARLSLASTRYLVEHGGGRLAGNRKKDRARRSEEAEPEGCPPTMRVDVIDVIEQVVTAMYLSNPDIWKQQWTAFTSAPYIVAPLIVFAGLVGWWLKGTTIAGLKRRFSVYEDRLKLAAKQSESARQAKDEVATEFETFKAEVAATAENAALGASAARAEGAIVRFAAANNALSEIPGVTEEGDIVNFRRQVPRGTDALSPSPNWLLRRSARPGRSVLKVQEPFSVGPS